jgi:hypothetical protein
VCHRPKQVAGQFSGSQRDSAWWGGIGVTAESPYEYIVRLFALMVDLSRLIRPAQGSVSGTALPEHLFSPLRRVSRTDQAVESLERSFEWAILHVRHRHNLRLPARLDRGCKPELCADAPVLPPPADFAHVPFAVVLSRVQGAMIATGVPLSPIDGLPPPDEGSPIFLHDMVSLLPPGGSCYADGAVRVDGGPEPAAVLDIWRANR